MSTQSGQSPRVGRVLLTGATGYVGGRLRKELEARGVAIVCLARRPESLAGRVGPLTEIVRGDLSVPETLESAM